MNVSVNVSVNVSECEGECECEGDKAPLKGKKKFPNRP